MPKKQGKCINIDCDNYKQKVEVEIGAEFECPLCHQHLEEIGEKDPRDKNREKNNRPNKKLIGIIAGAVVLLAIIGGIIAMSSGGEETPIPEPVAVAPIDSDSIKAAWMEAENQQLKDSLAAIEAEQAIKDSLAAVEAENAKKQEESVATPTPPANPRPVVSGGSKNLGYATFKGSWPNDVNGTMEFKSSHIIDSKDPKGRVAEAGDYVIGEWSDGHLVQGIWYGADNQVKGSIIIGK